MTYRHIEDDAQDSDSSIMSPEVRPLIQHQNTTPTHTPPNSLKRKHVSPVRQTPSGSQNAGGSSGNDPFPMSTGKFQKRVLYLLTDIRNLLGRQNEKAAEPDTAQPQEPFELLKSVQELIEFDETLKDKSNYDRLLSQLSKVGGSKIRENVKNVLLKIMNNEVMSALNMKGKGKSEKVGFARMNLYKAVVETVIKHQKNATEGEVRACTASILKYAPDRCGGAGRTNAEEN